MSRDGARDLERANRGLLAIATGVFFVWQAQIEFALAPPE